MENQINDFGKYVMQKYVQDIKRELLELGYVPTAQDGGQLLGPAGIVRFRENFRCEGYDHDKPLNPLCYVNVLGCPTFKDKLIHKGQSKIERQVNEVIMQVALKGSAIQV